MDFGLLKKYTRDVNVLFVEDDTDFRGEFHELLQDIFPSVTLAVDGKDGLNKYQDYYQENGEFFDLIICDIKMPNMNGVEMVDSIYSINNEQMVVILSARNEFDYLLPLINLGIQQFFTKPINYSTFVEDMTKISAKLYNGKQNDDESHIFTICENIYWDREKMELNANDSIVELSKKEIVLLNKILMHNGRIYTVEELLLEIWGDEIDSYSGVKNLKNLISRLRKKVPQISIKNIYGMGYKVDMPITQ